MEKDSKHPNGCQPQSALGICIGASTVSLVQIVRTRDGRAPQISASCHPHDGKPQAVLTDHLVTRDPAAFEHIAATGRRFHSRLNLTTITEPQAVEAAYAHVKPVHANCRAIVSAGGETFMVYVLDRNGRIASVRTGNKCAAGTGEFYLQQLRRMDVSLTQAGRWSASEKPYPVSGRCSVFCKSDCTHATNKGIPRAQVTAGLGSMMAGKILELLKSVDPGTVMLTGGTAQNQMMVAHLKRALPDLIIPPQAPYFEALGAALWALDHDTRAYPGPDRLFRPDTGCGAALPPLGRFKNRVQFKHADRGRINAGDRCVLGVDVGSTTTKAVLLRPADAAILAAVYLRTNGDPVAAARSCYAALLKDVTAVVDPDRVHIYGLGVCGSGRQIAGLHALTDGVINEIIAHASAAAHFDPDVDTIFEIGGQDAKYTHLTQGVASDYAMNEACSAGTGSFLEESALETLSVPMTEIADVALRARKPPNFSDQCAAFIASDIKNAIHNGVSREDIVAGLVYSVCMNYCNRVKGNRPIGNRIFMQGGVCYNRAVPLAMAALIDRPIIVPPEPGLMGAFGVALEIARRIEADLLPSGRFDLKTLSEREVRYGKPFRCRGGRTNCDRGCRIAVVEIEGRQYPFGGACNRYDNLRRRIRHPVDRYDGVRQRQKLIFDNHKTGTGKPVVCINRSFLVNTYYPLYHTFFDQLGMEVYVPDSPVQSGLERTDAAFCFPAELAHGYFQRLLNDQPSPEVIFAPHFKAVPILDGNANSQVCPLVQGETFYLQTAFRKELAALRRTGCRILAPLIDLSGGLRQAEKTFVDMACELGFGRNAGAGAFSAAVARQTAVMRQMRALGRELIAETEADPRSMAVVLFARPYNGFEAAAHMGIPNKFATRGVRVIPLDFLALENEQSKAHMYWGMGQLILMGAHQVKRHPQLFGTYITNFSCGPDSFLIGYFRRIMGRKPSLTLEVDSHTADAGLETRIEAFLDIVKAYRQLESSHRKGPAKTPFRAARLTGDKGAVVTSAGARIPVTDPRVTLLIPSMGQLGSEALAAAFRGVGLNARAHFPADEAVLKLGRKVSSGKECLPLILTTGALLNYTRNLMRPDEILVYFMATASGPCRFGQYAVFLSDLIRAERIPDVALMSFSSHDAYQGGTDQLQRNAWSAVVVADVMEDIRAMLLANALDAHAAMRVFDRQWNRLLRAFDAGGFKHLTRQLGRCAQALKEIQLKKDPRQVPTIALSGEIFVRRDPLSRRYLTERLAAMGFATVCAPVAEWLRYTDYVANQGLAGPRMGGLSRLRLGLKLGFKRRRESIIKQILSKSGLVQAHPIDIAHIVNHAAPFISRDLLGEAVLTVGGALAEIGTHVCGVIAIGPFGCMPNRLAESILTGVMNSTTKKRLTPCNRQLATILDDVDDLPFLVIESDGAPFPQVIDAKLDAFCLQAERLHKRMLAAV